MRRRRRWTVGLIGVFVLAVVMAWMPSGLTRGRTRAVWRLTPDWRFGASSGRFVIYDEPYPPRPGGPPGVVYQVSREQFGWLALERSRPVPPRRGDFPEWDAPAGKTPP